MKDLKTELENEQTTAIKTIIESILAGELVESTNKFSDILTNKIAVKLEESKIAVAKSLYGIKESEKEEDEKSSETSDEDFHKSLHARLKTAEDMDDNPLKDDEKENPNDKRVIAGLKARAAKGNMTKPNAHRDIPLKSGYVTLKDGEAKHINNFLSGLKPDKRKEVLDHMHKSPEHFNKIHDIVKKFPSYSQNSSIYSESLADKLKMIPGAKPSGSVEDQIAARNKLFADRAAAREAAKNKTISEPKQVSQTDKDEIERKARGYGLGKYQGD